MHLSDDDKQIEQDTNANKVPNLLLLGPKTLNLESRIDYKNDCYSITIPRSIIKSGLYYSSADCHDDGGTFRITESEQHVDEGGERDLV